MNAVEIEAAISELALEPFDREAFPFAFLQAFGHKDTTLKRLRAGNNNASDIPGAVLLRNNIHIAVCEPGNVGETLKALHASTATTKAKALDLTLAQHARFIRRIYGSAEFIRGLERYCLWIEDAHLDEAMVIDAIRQRIEGVRAMRLASRDKSANEMADRAHQMREMNIGINQTIVTPCVSSESRGYLPVGLIDGNSTITNLAFALYDAPLWNMALIASRLHLIWIGTVCGKLKTDFRYSNTLGWNTFPVPLLTEQNKADLTACAENILLAREAHFPATIADLYDPANMPDNLRHAHERNDEVLERIYIGRRFKNDTERLEKLFDLYTKMTTTPSKPKPATKAARGKKA